MATTTDYLNQLKKDLTTAKTNLANLGVEVLESDTFTEVSEKMASLQSGGDLSEYFTETITKGTSNVAGWVNAFIKFPAIKNIDRSCSYMFSGLKCQQIDLTKIDTSNVTEMSSMFYGCSGLTSLDVSHFDTSQVTNMMDLFRNCSSIETLIGIENFDTRQVTNMGRMFYAMQKIKTLDLSNFNTDNVTSMIEMFRGNSQMTTLNVSNFNISKISQFNFLFGYCSSLTTLDLSSFDFTKATQIQDMFRDCTNLTNLTFGRNLGLGYSTAQSANYSYYSMNLSYCPNLTEASLISVLNGLADIKSLGVQTQTCNLGSTNLAKLTSEAGQQALAQAQAYGWTVS